MWERFSYYGIRRAGFVHVSPHLQMVDSVLKESRRRLLLAYMPLIVYLASLPGGWIADKLLGLQKSILYGAICISAGHISIGISAFLGGKQHFPRLGIDSFRDGASKAQYLGNCGRPLS